MSPEDESSPDLQVSVTFDEILDGWGVPERYDFSYDVDDEGTIKGTSGGDDNSPLVALMMFPDYSESREEGT